MVLVRPLLPPKEGSCAARVLSSEDWGSPDSTASESYVQASGRPPLWHRLQEGKRRSHFSFLRLQSRLVLTIRCFLARGILWLSLP